MTTPFRGLEVDAAHRPSAGAFAYDIESRLASVVALEARVPDDAFTAETLGTERLGNAIMLNEAGLALTIGYLVTEAQDVWLTTTAGRRVAAHVLGVDQATGFGLVHTLEPLGVPTMPLGDSRDVRAGDAVVTAGGGGFAHALTGELLAHAPFSGYWEYHLDDALFVAPAHPHWSGAALIGPSGRLVGVGSLRVDQRLDEDVLRPLNMFVPAELLAPILDDLAHGRVATPPRPWLGVFAQEFDGHVVVLDVSKNGPAAKAELRRGDIVRAVAGQPVSDLADFYRRLWEQGSPGVFVPLTLQRGRDVFDVEVRSADRRAVMRRPRLN